MERKVCTYCGMEGHRASQCPRRPRERDIEKHLVKRVKSIGGEVRKVQWIGHRGAPDRLVMLPNSGRAKASKTIWVELKAPGEKASTLQLREHEAMRQLGQRVAVVDSIESVEALLR